MSEELELTTEHKSNLIEDFIRYDQTKHKSTLYIGMKIIAKDTINKHCPATILEIKENNIHISYNGWANKWNEWIKITCNSQDTNEVRIISIPRNIYSTNDEVIPRIFDELWDDNKKYKITSDYSLICGPKTIYTTKQHLADNFELFNKYFNLTDKEEKNDNVYKMKNIQNPDIVLMIMLYTRNKWKQSLFLCCNSDIADILNLFSFYQCSLNKLLFKDIILKLVTKENLCEILDSIYPFIRTEPMMCNWILKKIAFQGLIDYSDHKIIKIL